MAARTRIDWKAAAERLAVAIPRERLHPDVLAWTCRPAAKRAPWAVALSGGADSVALLLLLWAHWPERRGRLRVLHFNHRLRGRDSQADAVFCRQLSRALGLQFTSEAWKDRPRRSRDGTERVISEEKARLARMMFFYRHAHVLWLGHQQDDIAETMLMRLARGSGAGGLAAPRPVQPIAGDRARVHLRPLLTLKKAEIAAHLQTSGATWRNDATNATDAFFRNRIRAEVLPVWVAAARRDALAGAALSRTLLAEDDAALEAWLESLAPIGRRRELRLSTLAGKPRALLRRGLHRWLLAQSTTFSLSRQAFEGLLASVERGTPTRQSVGTGGFAVIRRGELVFEAGKPRSKFQRRVN